MDVVELVLLYLALCLVAGIVGRNRRIGFWGFLFGSVIFTPIISLMFLYFADGQPMLATTWIVRDVGADACPEARAPRGHPPEGRVCVAFASRRRSHAPLNHVQDRNH